MIFSNDVAMSRLKFAVKQQLEKKLLLGHSVYQINK